MSVPAPQTAIRERIEAVMNRVANACARVGRPPASVTLIAVSKTWPAEAVRAASNAGVSHFGENRVQEALLKIDAFDRLAGEPPLAAPEWHLIGHLQTNKARASVGRFAILHAVDSERLLRAVSAAAHGPQRVAIEVNVAAESTKFGIAPQELSRMIGAAAELPNVRVEGLMTVAPLSTDAEQSRKYFRALRELATASGLELLSMGMSGDFEVAVEEGATHIRVGRAIFGERA